jgi:hypothetical protein
MRIIKLKCELDQANYDQTVREVAVESEDENNWYGKPVANPACLTLQWPKFAWKQVEEEGARKARQRSPSPGTNLNPTRRKIDATKP